MDDTWLQTSYIYIGKVKQKLETNTSYMVGRGILLEEGLKCV